MAYGMLVAAVVTAMTVTGLCFAVGWRKLYMLAPLQFVAALVVTSVMGPLTVSDVYAGDAFFLALVISALMPLLFVPLRVLFWLLDRPSAGDLAAHARNRAEQRL